MYRRSSELAEKIFALTKRRPAEERYSLADQIRRAARSVGAHIAESWAKRRYEAHFVSKLTEADGENHEVEHWLLTARRDGYRNPAEFEALLALKREFGAKLGRTIQSPGPFLLK